MHVRRTPGSRCVDQCLDKANQITDMQPLWKDTLLKKSRAWEKVGSRQHLKLWTCTKEHKYPWTYSFRHIFILFLFYFLFFCLKVNFVLSRKEELQKREPLKEDQKSRLNHHYMKQEVMQPKGANRKESKKREKTGTYKLPYSFRLRQC